MQPEPPLEFAMADVCCVRVDPLPPVAVDFLESYLRPFFPRIAVPNAATWRLHWTVAAPHELESLVRSRQDTPLERDVIYADSTWFAWHRDDPADPWTCELLDEAAQTLHVFVASILGVGLYIIARAIRSLLATLACSAGWSQVHASGFCFANKAILVVGGKGVGKTSILLTSLTRKAQFLSNDRVLIKNEGGLVAARGLPHSVTVRTGTGAAEVMRDVVSTYGDRQPSSTGQGRYNVADVLATTGTTVNAYAALALVVAPAVVNTGVKIERVTSIEAEALLQAERRRSTSLFDLLWDAWRPQPENPIVWPDAAGIKVRYGANEVVTAVDAIREEVRRAG